MHVHLEETSPTKYVEEFTQNDDVAFNSIGFAKSTLMAGFTTVRDLGGSGVNVRLENANQGKVVGPRILTAEKQLRPEGMLTQPMDKDLMGNQGRKKE
jgi:imidazolonepropionase-like amidohydrolase